MMQSLRKVLFRFNRKEGRIRIVIGSIVAIALLSRISFFAWNPYLEILAHFKVQYLLICLILSVYLLVCHQKKLLFIALVCIGLQLGDILPWYHPAAAGRSSAQPNLRVLLSNVYEKNRDYPAVRSLVQSERPDVVAFLEATPIWQQELQSLKSTFPYSLKAPGIVLYSRIPLKNTVVFGPPAKKSLAANLTINQRDLTLIVTHPLPPKPDLFDFRNQQLKDVADYVKQRSLPVVLVGDLNTTMWSPYYKQFIEQSGLINARQGFGILPTWSLKGFHTKIPAFLAPLFSIPIDHCLISPQIQTVRIHTGQPVGSDHSPLVTDLFLARK